MNLETASGGRDALIYLAGPLINLTISGILSPFSHSPALKMIANINRDIALSNLLPIYPLGGGQLLAGLLVMGAVTPSGVNRIILCCSRVCCLGLGIYALNARDVFLAALVVFLCLLSCWLLEEDAEPKDNQVHGDGRLTGTAKRFHRYRKVLIVILLLVMTLPAKLEKDGNSRIPVRPQPAHIANLQPVESTQGKRPNSVVPQAMKAAISRRPPRHSSKSPASPRRVNSLASGWCVNVRLLSRGAGKGGVGRKTATVQYPSELYQNLE